MIEIEIGHTSAMQCIHRKSAAIVIRFSSESECHVYRCAQVHFIDGMSALEHISSIATDYHCASIVNSSDWWKSVILIVASLQSVTIWRLIGRDFTGHRVLVSRQEYSR
jgi:hypothetical protein